MLLLALVLSTLQGLPQQAITTSDQISTANSVHDELVVGDHSMDL
jgi:hypothetical protein